MTIKNEVKTVRTNQFRPEQAIFISVYNFHLDLMAKKDIAKNLGLTINAKRAHSLSFFRLMLCHI